MSELGNSITLEEHVARRFAREKRAAALLRYQALGAKLAGNTGKLMLLGVSESILMGAYVNMVRQRRQAMVYHLAVLDADALVFHAIGSASSLCSLPVASHTYGEKVVRFGDFVKEPLQEGYREFDPAELYVGDDEEMLVELRLRCLLGLETPELLRRLGWVKQAA